MAPNYVRGRCENGRLQGPYKSAARIHPPRPTATSTPRTLSQPSSSGVAPSNNTAAIGTAVRVIREPTADTPAAVSKNRKSRRCDGFNVAGIFSNRAQNVLVTTNTRWPRSYRPGRAKQGRFARSRHGWIHGGPADNCLATYSGKFIFFKNAL